jgi:hypothetical protein
VENRHVCPGQKSNPDEVMLCVSLPEIFEERYFSGAELQIIADIGKAIRDWGSYFGTNNEIAKQNELCGRGKQNCRCAFLPRGRFYLPVRWSAEKIVSTQFVSPRHNQGVHFTPMAGNRDQTNSAF